MRRRSLVTALLSAPLLCGAFALARADQPAPRPSFTLIQLSAFTCERCQQLDQTGFDRIKAVVKSQGGEFDFAPLPQHGEPDVWPVRLYYASRAIPGEPPLVRKAFFSAAENGIDVTSASKSIAWLSQQIPDVYWGRFLMAVQQHKAGLGAMTRAAKLYTRFAGGEFPVYVGVAHGKVVLVGRGGDLNALTEKVISWVQKQ